MSALVAGQVVDLPHGPALSVAAHDPDGFASVRAVSGAPTGVFARNELAPVPLPGPDLVRLESMVQARRHALSQWGTNELRISPVSVQYSYSARRLVLNSAVTDFAAHAAVREFVQSASDARRRLWFGSGLCPTLAHGMATSVAVVSSDLQLLLVQRSSSSLAGDTWDVGIGESQCAEDLSVDWEGRLVWDPKVTAMRGLSEELGVKRVSHLAFHTLGVNLADGSTSLFALAYVGHSGAQLLSMFDRDELAAAELVPWQVDGARELLDSRTWAPWAAAKLVTSLVMSAGPAAVRSAGLL